MSGCYDIYFENLNFLYNRPRDFLGLSAKLHGTGFMVTDGFMQRIGGWNTESIVEDAEFSAVCAENGVRVHFISDAVTYDEQPTAFSQSLRQRKRWSFGLLRVASRHIPQLLSGGFSKFKLDSAVFLSMIYTQMLALTPAMYNLWVLDWHGALLSLLISAVGFCAGMMAQALMFCLIAGRSVRRMFPAILLYPLFTASWYPLHFWAFFSRKCAWKPILHTGHKVCLPKGRGERSKTEY